MSPLPKNLTKFTKDIRTIYQSAMQDGKWYTALQAIVAQAKLLGYFQRRQVPKIQRLTDMNEGELLDLLHILDHSDPDLRIFESPDKKEERESRERRRTEYIAPKLNGSHPPPDGAST